MIAPVGNRSARGARMAGITILFGTRKNPERRLEHLIQSICNLGSVRGIAKARGGNRNHLAAPYAL
jgi:hypothetical protein